jgi:hypothetical protein
MRFVTVQTGVGTKNGLVVLECRFCHIPVAAPEPKGHAFSSILCFFFLSFECRKSHTKYNGNRENRVFFPGLFGQD